MVLPLISTFSLEIEVDVNFYHPMLLLLNKINNNTEIGGMLLEYSFLSAVEITLHLFNLVFYSPTHYQRCWWYILLHRIWNPIINAGKNRRKIRLGLLYIWRTVKIWLNHFLFISKMKISESSSYINFSISILQ